MQPFQIFFLTQGDIKDPRTILLRKSELESTLLPVCTQVLRFRKGVEAAISFSCLSESLRGAWCVVLGGRRGWRVLYLGIS